MTVTIKLALPKGRLLAEVAALLQELGWGLSGYHEEARSYRLKCRCFPDLSVKVFQEKDIPIQVAVGNYDLGICGLDWVEELLIKYPSSALVKVRNLECSEGVMYVAASREKGLSRSDVVRIASEYPNLAESFAVKSRLKRFNIFPVWGAAQVYPPESADLVLLTVKGKSELAEYNLVPVSKVFGYSAFLIANRNSWGTKDMAEVLNSIAERPVTGAELSAMETRKYELHIQAATRKPTSGDVVRLALPDGHQQMPTLKLLNRASIHINDYPSTAGNRRPTIGLEKVTVKVIRPQDMPSQVANGNFDLAVTGRDWLREHLYQFPSSPVAELLDLGSGRVKIVAVVSQELAVDDASSLRQYNAERMVPLHVASEYVNIADKYARDNHLGRYRVIPTWGASEAFLPEDADLLIENTETGRTLARHNLKIIDTIFESTACLVGNTAGATNDKGERIKSIVDALRQAVEGS